MVSWVRLAILLVLAFAVSALAQDSSHVAVNSAADSAAYSEPQASARSSASPRAANESEATALQAYWSPERLASAIPMPLPKVDKALVNRAATPSPAEPIHSTAGGRPSIPQETTAMSPQEGLAVERFPLNQGPEVEADNTAAPATATPEAFVYEMPFNNFRTGNNNVYPYSTVGKLFFVVPAGASQPAGNYVCSGAVALDSHTVVTARHCVFDYVSKQWYSGWVFYPGWNNGGDSTLGGAWHSNFAYTWTSSATLSLSTGYDIGLLSMHDNTGTGCGGDKGKTIGSFTGFLGSIYGGDYAQRQWNIFGYPQAVPFEGNYLYQDNGATGAVNPQGSTNVVQVGNPQTNGASGGPWIIGFDPGKATNVTPNNNISPSSTNVINGVNSFSWTNPAEPLSVSGTVFQSSNFWNLYTAYQAIACK